MSTRYRFGLRGLTVLRGGAGIEVPWTQLSGNDDGPWIIRREFRAAHPDLPRMIGMCASSRARRIAQRIRIRQIRAGLHRGQFSRALIFTSEAAQWWLIAVLTLIMPVALLGLLVQVPLGAGGDLTAPNGVRQAAAGLIVASMVTLPLVACSVVACRRGIAECRARRRGDAIVAVRFHGGGLTVDRLDGMRRTYTWSELRDIGGASLRFGDEVIRLPATQCSGYRDILTALRAEYGREFPARKPDARLPRAVLVRCSLWALLAGLLGEVVFALLAPALDGRAPHGAALGLMVILSVALWLQGLLERFGSRIQRRFEQRRSGGRSRRQRQCGTAGAVTVNRPR